MANQETTKTENPQIISLFERGKQIFVEQFADSEFHTSEDFVYFDLMIDSERDGLLALRESDPDEFAKKIFIKSVHLGSNIDKLLRNRNIEYEIYPTDEFSVIVDCSDGKFDLGYWIWKRIVYGEEDCIITKLRFMESILFDDGFREQFFNAAG
jgi:hypothetical protein